MIERVLKILHQLILFAYVIWPLFILTGLFYAIPGRGGLKAVFQRIRATLTVVWLVLAGPWMVSLFSPEPVQTIIPVEPLNTILFLTGYMLLVGSELLRRLKITPLRVLDRLAGRINSRADMRNSSDLAALRNLSPSQFEALVAETYRALGYAAQAVGRSGDHGVDVDVRTRNGQRWIVQCKRYHDPVGEETVRELYGTLHHEGADLAILVTSSSITPPAAEWARGKPIRLVDGPSLLKLIARAKRQSKPGPLDLFAGQLRQVFNPVRPPSGLQGKIPAGTSTIEETQHYAQRQRSSILLPSTDPDLIPICPRCQVKMHRHPRDPRLYRCPNYPTCRISLDRR